MRRSIFGIQTVVQVVSWTSGFVEWQKLSANLVSTLQLALIEKAFIISHLESQMSKSFMFAIEVIDSVWKLCGYLHSWGLESSQSSLFWSIVDYAQKSLLAMISFCTGWTSLCFPQMMNSKWSFLEHLINWGSFLAESLREPDCPPST